MKEQDYDELVAWQDILDEIMAGRTKGHHCPKCQAPGLDVDKNPARVFVRCNDCGVTFEGRLKV